jgi:hypothetical protein
MAIIHPITERGITFNYHRIAAVQSNFRGQIVLRIESFPDAGAAAAGGPGTVLMDDQPIPASFVGEGGEVPPRAQLYDWLLASSDPLRGGTSDEEATAC